MFWGLYSLREYVAYPIFWDCAEKKGIFLVWPLVGFFIALQLSLNGFGFSLLVLIFLEKSLIVTPNQFILTFIILDILCKNKPPNSRMIDEARNIRVKNHLDDSSVFCKINMYGLEYFRCVCHELLSIFYVTFLPSGWTFTLLIIMFHRSCTW